MKFEAKLNLKFYIVAFLLLGLAAFGWYGVFFLNANEILMEDNTPMDSQTKMLFTVVLSAVVLSWTFSFITMLKQIFTGIAFSIDDNGINSTVTVMNVFAFVFVVPIRKIPYSAIKRISKDDGVLTLHIDKTKLDMVPMLRIFVNKKYRLFSGFIATKQGEIEAELKKHMDC